MRDLDALDKYRVNTGVDVHWGGPGDKRGGAFVFGSDTADVLLRVIASVDRGWDHVSVSLEDRTPTWAEMEQIKRLFFKDHETAYQLHVPAKDHINIHPYTLHLWRHRMRVFPHPPKEFV